MTSYCVILFINTVSEKNVANGNLNKTILHKYLSQSRILLWYFLMLTSIAENLKNIHRHITEILLFDLIKPWFFSVIDR